MIVSTGTTVTLRGDDSGITYIVEDVQDGLLFLRPVYDEIPEITPVHMADVEPDTLALA